ncbi:hypothetical protein C8R44DRAFT_888411 [Mycena epipterygia]|nr:hypothetical protein C8R44DRAFT_888411 [Mycena epipterygia]
MQFIAVLFAAASVAAVSVAAASIALAQTVPTVSSFSAASYFSPAGLHGTGGCFGRPLATWSGVPEDAFCQATPGALGLSVTPGTETNCQIDLYTTSNCDGTTGGFISTVPITKACFTASQEFASVRILCITTG